MKAIFEMTSEYLHTNFKGSAYLEGSGTYDHSVMSAMWTLSGNQVASGHLQGCAGTGTE